MKPDEHISALIAAHNKANSAAADIGATVKAFEDLLEERDDLKKRSRQLESDLKMKTALLNRSNDLNSQRLKYLEDARERCDKAQMENICLLERLKNQEKEAPFHQRLTTRYRNCLNKVAAILDFGEFTDITICHPDYRRQFRDRVAKCANATSAYMLPMERDNLRLKQRVSNLKADCDNQTAEIKTLKKVMKHQHFLIKLLRTTGILPATWAKCKAIAKEEYPVEEGDAGDDKV